MKIELVRFEDGLADFEIGDSFAHRAKDLEKALKND